MKRNPTFTDLCTFTLLLTSCFSGTPLIKGRSDNNKTFEIDYLFEHDGCKVYRFYDMGNYIYFTNNSGNITAIKNDSTKTRTITISHNELK